MDVQELLSDSGIGREMHVIVGQGKLSRDPRVAPGGPPGLHRGGRRACSSTASARRRRSASSTSMSANLARLTDLTTELRRQLKPLGRQAEMARRAQTIQADLRDARLRLAADDLVTRQAEFDDTDQAETTLRREHDEVAARLEVATVELAAHEAAVAGADRARRGRPADLVPAVGAGRTGQRDGAHRQRARPATSTPSRQPAPGPTPTRWRPRPTRSPRTSSELLAELAESREPAGGRPRRAGRDASASPPRPNARTWPPCAPRPTAAKDWPGWPVRSTPCAPGSSRSTTSVARLTGAHRGGRRPRAAGPGRVRDRAEPRRRTRRRARSASTSSTTARSPRCGWPTSGSPNCRPPSAPPNGRWPRCGPASTRSSVGLDRKDGAAWLSENRSGAGLFGIGRQAGQGAPRLRGGGGGGARRGRRRAWPPTTSAPPARRSRRSRRPTADARRSCWATGPRRPRRTTRPLPDGRACGRSTWSTRRRGCAAR